MNEERRTKNQEPLRLVAVVGLVWLLMLGGDWFMRFRWFRWQDTFVSKPFSSPAASDPACPPRMSGLRGGDLTQLVGIPAVAEPFKEQHPDLVVWVDENGNRNKPPTIGTHYPIVTVGDSFMENGGGYEDLFFRRLSEASGLPVYNHAMTGRGSFLGLLRFLSSPRFREDAPKVIVWGILEREIRGGYFAGMVGQLESGVWTGKGAEAPSRIQWRLFLPAELKRSLPNSSAVSLLSARVWNEIRYLALGRINPLVIMSERSSRDCAMLFYSLSVDAMRWTQEERDVPKVAWSIERAEGVLRARGARLVVVLIPDKEQVYRDWLPASVGPLPESCLYALEESLRERGIPVVNLLDAFRAEAMAGSLLYWRDDTHWNPAGIDLAARLAWEEIVPLLADSD